VFALRFTEAEYTGLLVAATRSREPASLWARRILLDNAAAATAYVPLTGGITLYTDIAKPMQGGVIYTLPPSTPMVGVVTVGQSAANADDPVRSRGAKW